MPSVELSIGICRQRRAVRGTAARFIEGLIVVAPFFMFPVVVAPLHVANAWAAEPPCPAGVPMHLDLPATRNALSHREPVSIIALGSSSTEGIGASAPDRAYPARLEALLQVDLPGAAVTVSNKGVGGQTADAVLARLDADALAAKPTLVIWQVGTNEALRGMDPTRFAALLDDGLRQIALSGSDVVLMDYQIAPKMPAAEQLAVYGAVITAAAKAHGVSLFSRAALMRSWQTADPWATDMVGPDGLHQTDRGYACLAESLGKSIVAAAAPPIAITAPIVRAVPPIKAVKVNLK